MIIIGSNLPIGVLTLGKLTNISKGNYLLKQGI